MGIIKKQSIYVTLVSYIGLAIGAINTLLLLPHFLTQSQVGLIGVFTAIAFPLAAISNVGSIFAINRFLPYYKKLLPPTKNDLPLITVITSLLGFCIVFILVYLGRDLIFNWFSHAPLLVDYFYLIPLFTLGYMLYGIFQALNIGYYYTVWVGTVSEVIFRVFNVIIILFLVCGLYEFNEYFHLYVFMFWIGLVLFFLKLKISSPWFFFTKISSLTKRIKSYIFQYSTFFWFTSVFSVLATMIDSIVLAGIQGLEKTGSWMIATYFITVTLIPQRSMISVSIPVIAESWRKKDMANLSMIYWKSANNMLWAGGFIFLCILLNINEILSFLPEGYHEIKWVILVLGMAKLVDYATGVNQNILALSRKNWKFDLYTNILLVCLLIPLNYFLIKQYGIIGSAFANLVGFFIYNFIRTTYLWVALRITPFNIQNSKLLTIIGLFLMIFVAQMYYFEIPDMIIWKNPLVIIFKSGLFLILYFAIILQWKASDDVREILVSGLEKVKKQFKK
ncbi:MAG: polysaccharide biosynthesis C-terminal domain-containing protein [Saprospiraceae bacterium]